MLTQFKKTAAPDDPVTGAQLQEITWIEKGSAFEKTDVKVGDLITSGNKPIN